VADAEGDTTLVVGELAPTPNLLPAGTTSITLSLTTAAPAHCRWTETSDTRYQDMPNEFENGQGTRTHTTVVGGLSDLDNRWFYVRCAVQQPGGGAALANDVEHVTHVRVLGPWTPNYPALAILWSRYNDEWGPNVYAQYDLVVAWHNDDEMTAKAAAIRARNPDTKILLTQNATYGHPQWDALAGAWADSQLGDPDYLCLLRDAGGEILLVNFWGHPMYNMTQDHCVTQLVEENLRNFHLRGGGANTGLAYDGLYWDLLRTTISSLSPDIDSNLDGQPDDPAVLDAAYQAGVEDFLRQMRVHLPDAVLVGNGSGPLAYAPWVNGVLYEIELPALVNNASWFEQTWGEVISGYTDWSCQGREPHVTFIQSAPDFSFKDKYTAQNLDEMPPAMVDEVAASYRQMRYGLTSALMGDGLYSFDYGDNGHGLTWWYDEFGRPPGASGAGTLPWPGYLGQPIGDPVQLLGRLLVENPIRNGGFEDGLRGWGQWVNEEAGAAATYEFDASEGVAGGAALVTVTAPTGRARDVILSQRNLQTVAGQTYMVTFWARSNEPLPIQARIIQQVEPWEIYGPAVETRVTPEWQRFELPLTVSTTANDGELEFLFGENEGQVWLDEVEVRGVRLGDEGEVGIWAREFSNGLVVINSTHQPQTVTLPGTYCKLNGDQAPLFQTRVEDSEARASVSWVEHAASPDQFGPSVRVAARGDQSNPPTIVYTPALAHGGEYEVLAWVAPDAAQTRAAQVTIRHANGQSVVPLDQSSGEVGWRSLGRYDFGVGTVGSVTLTAGEDGLTVADAFKWETTARYNDGSTVRDITLQPQDGIVLLSSCHEGQG
jgi:hypothetical protein